MTEPRAPRDFILEDYALRMGDAVEVSLLTQAGVGAVPSGPLLVEGEVVDATTTVVVIETRQRTRVRVSWQAVATIRDRVTTHPGL